MATAVMAPAKSQTLPEWTVARELIRNCLDPDISLVERCLSGDAGGWEDFVRGHGGGVYGICYLFMGREGEAQDLPQDVFLRLSRPLKSFRAKEVSFPPWLTRLTRNLLIDNYR